jgi:hypothetical protein
LADAVGHGDNGEAESRGDAKNIDRSRTSSHSGNDRCAAADQNKRKRSNEFRNYLFSR